MTRALRLLLIASLGIFAVFAQQRTAPGIGGAPGSGTNPPGTIGLPGTALPPASGTGSQTNPMPGISGEIFLSGKVAIADGSPVPVGISIRRLCGISTRTVAYTDSKGHFSFVWGQTQGIMPDAEDTFGGDTPRSPNGRNNSSLNQTAGSSPNSMINCELLADAPGFRSDTVRLDDHRMLDNPDVGTIVLHRLANVEGTSVSATSFTAPSDARKAYEKGLQSLQKGKTADAQKNFEKAVAIYPKYANAWLDLGRSRLHQKSIEPAREAFRKALEADGKLVAAQIELGILAAQESKWVDAARYLDDALRLDPVDFPQAWFIDAVADFNTKNYAMAEKSVRAALKLDPQHKNPQADQLLGLILATKGEYPGAAEELRTYLKLAPGAPDADKVKAQLAQVERMQSAARPAAPLQAPQ